MKLSASLAPLLVAAASLLAQTPQAASMASAQGTSNSPMTVLPDLEKLQSAATETSLAIGRMRIEKWKTDANTKQQAQSNADSIQRNVASALPGVIAAVRSTPQDLNSQFRLYRNVNALYDVMTSLTESAGAFSPKGEYEVLAQQLETIDAVRHDLADSIERMTSSMQAELAHLRQLVRAAQQAAVAPTPPKTTVVDDNEPVKASTAHKKKPAAKKPPASPPAANSNTASGTEAKQ